MGYCCQPLSGRAGRGSNSGERLPLGGKGTGSLSVAVGGALPLDECHLTTTLGRNSMVDHPRVRSWLEIRDPLEQQLEPLGRAAMEAIGLSAGDRVLDVGCGIGGTPIALANMVGSTGQVIGLELLQAAVDVAQRDPGKPDNVAILCGDAQIYAFAPGSFDAIFSRFGVMFFDDPIEGFRNLLNALRPGGRLGFVCWRTLHENELDELPLRVASPQLPVDLVSETASASWFSFSDAGHIRRVLGDAGFDDIEISARDELVSSGSLQAMVDVCSRVGALGAILREHPYLKRNAITALERALRERDSSTGPALRSATWVVTATARRAAASKRVSVVQ